MYIDSPPSLGMLRYDFYDCLSLVVGTLGNFLFRSHYIFSKASCWCYAGAGTMGRT